MGFLGIWGFESRDILRDGFTVLSGSVSYVTDVPVGGSTRALQCIDTTTTLTLADLFTTPSSEFWIILRYKPNANNAANDNHRIGWRASNTLRGYVTFQDNTNLPQIYIGGVLQTTGTSSLNVGSWHQLHIHVSINTTAGFVHVYKDGDLSTAVASFVGNTDPGTDLSMDAFWLQTSGGGGARPYFDDIIIMDPNDATGTTDINELTSPAVQPIYPTSDSATHTAWTQQGTPGGVGDYEFIDEVQPDDGDFIRATAAAQKSTFGFGDVSGGRVLGARVKARVLRGDTTAGVNIRTISRDAAVDYVGATQAAPGDGDIDEIYDTHPDGTTAWSTAGFNSVEWGVESVT